jgi:hypothetical protein
VHRGCTSEHCGFRQRRTAAQELESTTQEEDLKVVEHLGGKALWEKTQLQTKSLRSSVKLCQVGTEHKHKVQLEELCCEFIQKL